MPRICIFFGRTHPCGEAQDGLKPQPPECWDDRFTSLYAIRTCLLTEGQPGDIYEILRASHWLGHALRLLSYSVCEWQSVFRIKEEKPQAPVGTVTMVGLVFSMLLNAIAGSWATKVLTGHSLCHSLYPDLTQPCCHFLRSPEWSWQSLPAQTYKDLTGFSFSSTHLYLLLHSPALHHLCHSWTISPPPLFYGFSHLSSPDAFSKWP